MAVTTPRETWTDPRIDDLSKKVDDGFEKANKKMDDGFEKANKKMDDGFEKANKKMDDGFEKANKKMDDGFARVDFDLRELRRDMKAGLDRLDKKFDWPIRILVGATVTAILTHVF